MHVDPRSSLEKEKEIEKLLAFFDHSPTPWHAALQLEEIFLGHGFLSLHPLDPWSLEFGKDYFVKEAGVFCAFRIPKKKPQEVRIAAAHSDSPCLKVKPNGYFEKEGMQLLSLEVYGGVLLNSWLNRDLYLAGRIFVELENGAIQEQIVSFPDFPLVIPQLSIHLDKESQEKGLLLNKQEHTVAVLGLSFEGKEKTSSLEKILLKHTPFKRLISHDLFAVPLEKARLLGVNKELIASYRIDNLAGVFASTRALLSQAPPNGPVPSKPSQDDVLQMMIAWDHEEIGSNTRFGASSSLLQEILYRILAKLGCNEEERICIKKRSFCVSVDMAHAPHPGHEKKLDPHHAPLLGRGIVLKEQAAFKYATDGKSSVRILQLCHENQIPCQRFVPRGDMHCGSTVGPIIAHTTGIETVDIGCPQCSMHSIREVMAKEDFLSMQKLLSFFF